MKKALFVLAAVAAMLGLGANPTLAQTRVFVSGLGSDANPCSLSAPCRSFQHAHDTVVAGGEIVALDAAGYGPLAITKAVTVTAIGIEASITSNSTTPTAITINAGSADTVTIRGLTLISGFTSGDGIDVLAAKSVALRDCSISGFPGDGIRISPPASLDVEISQVSATNNGTRGLFIEPSSTSALTAVVTDSRFTGNTISGVIVNGQNSGGTIKVTLSVVAAANGGGGIAVLTASGAQPVVMVTGSKIVNNSGVGLLGQGNVLVFVDRTQITGNTDDGWFANSGAVVKSYMNNEVNGNTTDGLNGVVQITSE